MLLMKSSRRISFKKKIQEKKIQGEILLLFFKQIENFMGGRKSFIKKKKINIAFTYTKYVFDFNLKSQFILLFNLFLLLFMGSLQFLVQFIGSTVLFQLTFTFIYKTFSKKNFNFNKINRSRTDNIIN